MQDFLNSTNFTQIFIVLISIKFLLETYLKIRNLKSIDNNKESVPDRFKDVVTEESTKNQFFTIRIELNFRYLHLYLDQLFLSFLQLAVYLII